MTCPASTAAVRYLRRSTPAISTAADFTRVDIGDVTAQAQLSTVGSARLVFCEPAGSTVPVRPLPGDVSSSIADGRQHWSSFSTPCEAGGADFGSRRGIRRHRPRARVRQQRECGQSKARTAYVSTDWRGHWTARGTNSSLPPAGYVGPLAAADANTWVLAEQRGRPAGHPRRREAPGASASISGLTQGVDGWNQVVRSPARLAVPHVRRAVSS